MPANGASNSSSQLLGPKPALLLVAWLTVQLVVVFLMTALVGFHYGLTRSTLCLTTHNSSHTDAVNGSSFAGPSCVSNQVALSFAVIACIITVIDATINMDYLIHRARELPHDFSCKCSCNCSCNAYGDNCCGYVDVGNACDNYCCCNKIRFDYLPIGIVRVWYCWTLMHIILITVASNIYEWSWQTDDLHVLSRTVMFFFASFMYFVLFVAICIWQYTIFRTSVTTKCRNQSNGNQQNDYVYCIQFLVHCLSSVLFLSHLIATIAALFAFFYRPDIDGYSQIAVCVLVIVYVCFSSFFWFVFVLHINILWSPDPHDTDHQEPVPHDTLITSRQEPDSLDTDRQELDFQLGTDHQEAASQQSISRGPGDQAITNNSPKKEDKNDIV